MAQMLDIPNALAAGYTGWGQTAGQNIVRGRQIAEEQRRFADETQRRKAFANALPGLLAGDSGALAAAADFDPGTGATLALGMQKQQQDLDKQTEARVYADTAGALFGVSQMPQERQADAWKAATAALRSRYPTHADDLPDDWSMAPSIAGHLAVQDKQFADLFSRAGLLPPEPAKPEATPAEIQGYQLAQTQGYPGTFFQYKKDLQPPPASSVVSFGGLTPAVDAQGRPVFLQPSNRGGAPNVLPGFAPTPGAGKDPTEDQNKSYGFYKNAQNSLDDMQAVLKEDPNAWVPSIAAETLDRYVPVVGESAANKSLSPAQQRYRQAIYTIADMSLRAETGANAPEAEVRRKVQQLTPRPNDAPELRLQKQKAIEVIVDTLKARAGRALPPDQIPSAGAGNGTRPPLDSFQR